MLACDYEDVRAYDARLRALLVYYMLPCRRHAGCHAFISYADAALRLRHAFITPAYATPTPCHYAAHAAYWQVHADTLADSAVVFAALICCHLRADFRAAYCC